MTAAIGSAAPSGADALLQSGPGRMASNTRGQIKPGDERQAPSEDTSDIPRKAEADASGTRVDKAEKVSKRKHGKEKSDDDNSFEDTFASIGQDQVKDAGVKSNKYAAALPDLTVMGMAAAATLNGKADTADAGADAKQSTARPAALLQQKSILALLDAKERIANADQPAAKSVADTGGADDAILQSDTTEVVPMTLNRRETHWNFNSDALTSTASQLSALQSGNVDLSRSALMQGAPAASKEQTSETKSSAKGVPESVSQSVVMPDSDQSANPSFTNGEHGNQGSEQPRSQSVATAPIDRKAVKADAVSSLDQIFATAPNAQNASSASVQVRDGVIDSFSADNVNPSTSLSAVDVPTRPTSAPVLRTLDLTLSPADLGSVRLRMSLTSNTLSIEADTSKASTAKLLNDDRQDLERGLKDAGYDLSSLKITDASASNSANANGWQTNGSPQRDGDQTRSGFMGGQSGEMQGRDGSPSGQPQRRQREVNQQATPADVAAGRIGNAVYI